MLYFRISCFKFYDNLAIPDDFSTLFKSFIWFHLQKAALPIHLYSIDLGVSPKIVGAFSI